MRKFSEVLDECCEYIPERWARRAQKKDSVVRGMLAAVYKVVIVPIEQRLDSIEKRLDQLD
jgi:hypothetical protein